ncbi:DUF3093 domain-containing protein [Pseudonocardia sp.]|uniref:DUF3093 domain-containing protein n=1 Tax=Pseudonocardia sp. TaxID=60912 RepID=UPI003D0CE703
MSHSPSPPGAAASGAVRFDERLSVPWWWYLLSTGVAVLLGAEIHMGYPGLRSWVGYVVAIVVAIAVPAWMGRTRVRVDDAGLRVGDEFLPAAAIGRADAVARADKQTALGPDLDPEALFVHRPWIGPVVRVEDTRPDSRTPYWVFSVRDPAALLAALPRRS